MKTSLPPGEPVTSTRVQILLISDRSGPVSNPWNNRALPGVRGSPKNFSRTRTVRLPALVFLMLLPLAASAQEATPTPAGQVLTLPDAIALGLTHAFGARIAGFREQAAAERVGAARTAFLPDLSVTLDDRA